MAIKPEPLAPTVPLKNYTLAADNEAPWDALQDRPAQEGSPEAQWEQLQGTKGGTAPGEQGQTIPEQTKTHYDVSQVPGAAWQNLLPSAKRNIVDPLVNAYQDPLGTAKNMGKAAVGLAGKAAPYVLPGGQINPAFEPTKNLLQKITGNEVSDAVVQDFSNAYGGWDNITRTFAEDPVRVIVDASTFLGGAGAAGKAAGLERVASGLTKASKLTDPVNLAAKGVKGTAGLGKNLFATSGTLNTAGSNSVHMAGRAGYESAWNGRISTTLGNAAAKLAGKSVERNQNPIKFWGAMHRKGGPDVDRALAAVDNIQAQHSSQYQGYLQAWKGKSITPDMSKIADAFKKGRYFKSSEAAVPGQARVRDVTREDQLALDAAQNIVRKYIPKAGVRQQMQAGAKIKGQRGLTFYNMDLMKQDLANLADAYAAEGKNGAAAAVGRVTDAVRDTLFTEADRLGIPEYRQAMEAYEAGQKQLKELRSTLSLKDSASVDTVLGKLYGAMVDTARSRQGARLNLVKLLADNGYDSLIYELAGSQLHPPVKTAGLVGGTVAGALGAGGISAAGLSQNLLSPLGVYVLASISPRIAGYEAYAGGKAIGAMVKPVAAVERNLLTPVGLTGRGIGLGILQGGRIDQQEKKRKQIENLVFTGAKRLGYQLDADEVKQVVHAITQDDPSVYLRGIAQVQRNPYLYDSIIAAGENKKLKQQKKQGGQ